MDIYDHTKETLKGIWDDDDQRQNAKILIMTAIGTVSEVTVKDADSILEEMDRLLLSEEEDDKLRTNAHI